MIISQERMASDESKDGRGTPRLTWVQPELRRLAAGSAEDASGPATDAVNPS